MRKQNELITTFAEAVGDSADKAATASKEVKAATLAVKVVSAKALEEVKAGTVFAVTEAIPKEINSLVKSSQEEIVAASKWASNHIKQTSE